MHDFNSITFVQCVAGVLAARNNRAVDLDRDPAVGQSLGGEQCGNRGLGRGLARLTVQLEFHVRIFACLDEYACGGATCER